MLECVVNVSEGRRADVVRAIAAAGGAAVLDVHSDADHHRSVLTMAGPRVEDAVRSVAARAVDLIDLRAHTGVHPRIGAVDVVPFVALEGSSRRDALRARDAFACWAGSELSVPCFVYGPERSLPDVRRSAFGDLAPSRGPSHPHPTAGAIAVGARSVLVAFNVWLGGAGLDDAKRIARELRGSSVRALGLAVGDGAQVSMNLVQPARFGPADAYDAVARLARQMNVEVVRAELVGLVPAVVLGAVPEARWAELGLGPDRTIESRLGRPPAFS